jgi:rsbT co-antagonist protein RsbR
MRWTCRRALAHRSEDGVGEQMELDQVSEDRIADILIVLSEVSCSNFTTRLPELEESDVFSTLYAAINEMASTLADAHERTERYQNELAEKIATIEEQRVAIRELSTPVIEVWDGVLCLPIVGVMDTTRGAEMTEVLLRTVTEKNAKCAIIDVTGIEVMDTGTADQSKYRANDSAHGSRAERSHHLSQSS